MANLTILMRALRVIFFTRDYPRFPGRGLRNNADRAYLEQMAKYDDNSPDKKCSSATLGFRIVSEDVRKCFDCLLEVGKLSAGERGRCFSWAKIPFVWM